MNRPNNPHDKFFKAAMQHRAVAEDFFRQYLPDSIKNALDFSTLRTEPGTYIDEALASHFSDVVFSCHLAGSDAYLALLVEHQSSPDRFMPFRVLHYLVNFLAIHLKAKPGVPLPAVSALVFYHGEQSPYPYSLELQDCFDDPLGLMCQVLTQSTSLVDVNQLGDDELRRQAWVGPMALAMKHIRDPDISALIPDLLGALSLLETGDRHVLDYLKTLVYYLINVGNIPDVEQFLADSQRLPEPIRGEMMTIAEKLEERGILKGKEEGRQQAKTEVAVNLLREGADDAFVAKISGLPLAQVLRLKASL